ncbi:MAG: hypothetical protein II474_03480, partial [Firmicutes bacterium]|nr:hypothetical protein [Bacillota bacterium]
MSKEELEQAMQARRERRANAKAKHARRSVPDAAEKTRHKGFRPYASLLLGPAFALFEILLSVLTGSGIVHAGVLHALALGLILGTVCGLLKEKVSFLAEIVIL